MEAEKTQGKKKKKKIENFSYLSLFAHLSRHVVVVVERKWIEKKGSLCFVSFAVLVFVFERNPKNERDKKAIRVLWFLRCIGSTKEL